MKEFDIHLTSLTCLSGAVDSLCRLIEATTSIEDAAKRAVQELRQECESRADRIERQLDAANERLDELNDQLQELLSVEDDEEDAPDTSWIDDRISRVQDEISDLSDKASEIAEVSRRIVEVESHLENAGFPQVFAEADRSRDLAQRLFVAYSEACRSEFGTSVHSDFGPGFWKRPRILMGKMVDVWMGQNVPSNAKIIDNTLPNAGAVSYKTTDVRLPSYRNAISVRRMVKKWVTDLSVYMGEIRVDNKRRLTCYINWAFEDPSAPRILEWWIPDKGVPPEHEALLPELVSFAADNNVQLRIYRALDYQ